MLVPNPCLFTPSLTPHAVFCSPVFVFDSSPVSPTGENAYFCESCGKKVDTLKRVALTPSGLPDVLALNLKRFALNFDTMAKEKINDAYRFPADLDVWPFTDEGLAVQAAGVIGPAGAAAAGGAAGGGEGGVKPPTSSSSPSSSAAPSSGAAGAAGAAGADAGAPSDSAGEGVADGVAATLDLPPAGDSEAPLVTQSSSASSSSSAAGATALHRHDCRYTLRGVLVHSGTASGGHYFSFARPREGDTAPIAGSGLRAIAQELADLLALQQLQQQHHGSQQGHHNRGMSAGVGNVSSEVTGAAATTATVAAGSSDGDSGAAPVPSAESSDDSDVVMVIDSDNEDAGVRGNGPASASSSDDASGAVSSVAAAAAAASSTHLATRIALLQSIIDAHAHCGVDIPLPPPRVEFTSSGGSDRGLGPPSLPSSSTSATAAASTACWELNDDRVERYTLPNLPENRWYGGIDAARTAIRKADADANVYYGGGDKAIAPSMKTCNAYMLFYDRVRVPPPQGPQAQGGSMTSSADGSSSSSVTSAAGAAPLVVPPATGTTTAALSPSTAIVASPPLLSPSSSSSSSLSSPADTLPMLMPRDFAESLATAAAYASSTGRLFDPALHGFLSTALVGLVRMRGATGLLRRLSVDVASTARPNTAGPAFPTHSSLSMRYLSRAVSSATQPTTELVLRVLLGASNLRDAVDVVAHETDRGWGLASLALCGTMAAPSTDAVAGSSGASLSVLDDCFPAFDGWEGAAPVGVGGLGQAGALSVSYRAASLRATTTLVTSAAAAAAQSAVDEEKEPRPRHSRLLDDAVQEGVFAIPIRQDSFTSTIEPGGAGSWAAASDGRALLKALVFAMLRGGEGGELGRRPPLRQRRLVAAAAVVAARDADDKSLGHSGAPLPPLPEPHIQYGGSYDPSAGGHTISLEAAEAVARLLTFPGVETGVPKAVIPFPPAVTEPAPEAAAAASAGKPPTGTGLGKGKGPSTRGGVAGLGPVLPPLSPRPSAPVAAPEPPPFPHMPLH